MPGSYAAKASAPAASGSFLGPDRTVISAGLSNPVAGALLLADLGIPAEVTREAGVEPAGYGKEFVIPVERHPPV